KARGERETGSVQPHRTVQGRPRESGQPHEPAGTADRQALRGPVAEGTGEAQEVGQGVLPPGVRLPRHGGSVMTPYDAWRTGEIGASTTDPRSPAYDSSRDEWI